MTVKKTVKKTADQTPVEKTSRPAPAETPRRVGAPALQPPVKKAVATARTCPLVLDGELDASDFSPGDCLTCSEFDCRFCEAEHGSGTLRSRLFAASDDEDDGDDGWGSDFDVEGGGEGEGMEDGEEDDLL